MAKVTKDTKKDELDNKKTSEKKEVTTVEKRAAKSNTTKTKKTSSTAKTSTTKKTTSNTKKKISTKTTSKKKTSTKVKELETNIVAEYYDLPYRYNETIVKILYQTPTILFVYWDISDTDKENFVNLYGEHFFENTKPILRIYNLTKKYDFEVEINDFANSWYININDANCEYKVELIRKTIKYEENLNTDYIYVTTSNNIEFPNDKLLIDELPDIINFRNVKTNALTTKNISTMRLVGINKIYKVQDFYNRFYKDEILEEITFNSSSSWN